MAPRSGLASKHFIDTGAGVIDADYRGEVKVLLFNFSDVDFTIKEGDRIAQLVLERVSLLFLLGFWIVTDRCRFIPPRFRLWKSLKRACVALEVLEVPVSRLLGLDEL